MTHERLGNKRKERACKSLESEISRKKKKKKNVSDEGRSWWWFMKYVADEKEEGTMKIKDWG